MIGRMLEVALVVVLALAFVAYVVVLSWLLWQAPQVIPVLVVASLLAMAMATQ